MFGDDNPIVLALDLIYHFGQVVFTSRSIINGSTVMATRVATSRQEARPAHTVQQWVRAMASVMRCTGSATPPAADGCAVVGHSDVP
jgi:hypothetical protein